MKRLLNLIAAFARMVVCRHRWHPYPQKMQPGDHGIIIMRVCIRCKAVEHQYASEGKYK